MLERFAALASAPLVRVPWITDAFPIDEVLARLDKRMVSCNRVPTNPTGGVASRDEVRTDRGGRRESIVLIDQCVRRYADLISALPCLTRECGRRSHDVEAWAWQDAASASASGARV